MGGGASPRRRSGAEGRGARVAVAGRVGREGGLRGSGHRRLPVGPHAARGGSGWAARPTWGDLKRLDGSTAASRLWQILPEGLEQLFCPEERAVCLRQP